MVILEQIFQDAKKAIVDHDIKKAKEVAEKGLAAGIDPTDLLSHGFIAGIAEVGDLFGMGRIFLPELMKSAAAMEEATLIMNAALTTQGGASPLKAKILIGTVVGDYHDIGKSLVVSLFKANGFDVLDIGRDVPIERFIEEAEKFNADVIGSSALLTTTMEGQKELEEELRRTGKKEKYKTIVGGAPVTQRWADRIGADAYAEDAADGIKKVKLLLGLK